MANVLKESDVLRKMIEKKSLMLVGGVYSLNTGKVDWLQADAMAAAAK